MSDVASDVVALIAKKSRAENHAVTLTDRLDDLGLTSLDAVELIFDLEEKFDVQIPFNANANAAALEFETVGDLVGAIKQLLATSKP